MVAGWNALAASKFFTCILPSAFNSVISTSQIFYGRNRRYCIKVHADRLLTIWDSEQHSDLTEKLDLGTPSKGSHWAKESDPSNASGSLTMCNSPKSVIPSTEGVSKSEAMQDLMRERRELLSFNAASIA